MQAITGQGATAEPGVGKVIPFPRTHPAGADGSGWSRASAQLRDASTARYAAWFQPLIRAGRAGGRLILRAPSRFHADYVMTHMASELSRSGRAARVSRVSNARLNSDLVRADGLSPGSAGATRRP